MPSHSTHSLGTFEAKNKLSALVEIASKGGRIWITKRGRRVALLSAGDEGPRAPVGDLVAAFRDIRNRAKKGRPSLKSLIEEGRR
jgi:prevent-host-death family protein